MIVDESRWPKCRDVWRNHAGITRHVGDVDDNGFWVQYHRPPPAPYEALTVTMQRWVDWVDSTDARKVDSHA